MALGHSPISFPTGKATNSPKRKYSQRIVSMPDRSNMEASARQFVSMLEMLNILSNQTRESISSFDGCSARSLGQVSRAELSDLKESLLAIEAEVYDLRVKLSQYSEIPAKAV